MKYPALTATAALLVVLGATAAATQDQRSSQIVQKIIVKVNGEILTQTELEQRQIEAVRALPNVSQITQAMLPQVVNDVTPEVLVKAVDDLLLVQRGKELGYRLTDERFQATLDSVKQENNLTDESLQEALRAEGITMAEYRNMMERTLIKDAVTREEILGTPNLTEAEMRQYYNAHPDEFLRPARVTLREVFIAVPTQGTGAQATFNAAEDEAARAKAAAARDRILGGEDMVAVVNEVSEGGSKANGGIVGPVNLDDISPAIKDAVSALEVGAVAEPLRLAGGYHVFKVESRTEAETAPFDEVREQIYQRILMSRVDAETAKYLERLRAQAVIEWKDDASRKLYEQGLTTRQSSGRP